MNRPIRQRGSILLIAIALIVSVSLLAVAFTSLYVSDTASSADHATASQALFVAESGLSNALEAFRTGTACNALNFNNVAFGNGTFTTAGFLHQPAATALTAAINAAATVIPVASTAGYAAHGRITVEAEQIDYTGITPTSFTGARRGVNGTAAAAHANGVAVSQNLCRVRSTGAVGASQRVVEGTAMLTAAVQSALFDTTPPVAISNAAAGTNIGGNLAATLPAGTNILIAAVSFQNTTGNIRELTGGRLSLRRGGVLASNQHTIRLGGGAAPSASVFPRATMFLLHRQINVPANPVYTINARSSGAGIFGEAKLLVINTPNPPANPVSAFVDGGAVNNISTAAAGSNLINNALFSVPAGDRVIIAAVQLYNSNNGANQNRSVAAGAVTLRRGPGNGPVLASNQLAFDLASGNAANRGASLLLIARDPAGAANQRYSVNVVATGGNNLRGEAKAVVLAVNGITAAVLDGVSTAVQTVDTVVGSMPTTLAAGEQVTIAATQFVNTANATRNIPAGSERLVSGVLPATASEFNTGLCAATVSPVCDDMTSGLLWRNINGGASPVFEVRAQADGLGINAETKMLAIGMGAGVNLIDWQEVIQ